MRNKLLLMMFIAMVVGWLHPETGGATASAQATSAEQQLADKFAPVAYLRGQTKACDRDGEGYFPAPIETVLGNPDVALKHNETGSSATDPIIKMAPTAQDLSGLDEDYYLDFPGNPRKPGCTFETAFKKYAAERSLQPTTYAHIVIDEENHRLVLQYWLWYYFNDWNNTHESDWEMVQLVFDATSAEEALEQEPILAGFAQHGGGETADYGDDKLAFEDGHVVVYPTAGSHSSHYDRNIFIGWGENGTGVGCDNSTSPSKRTPLTAVLVPDEIDATGPFAWLLFEGRWGERQPWEYNGPTGPNLKPRWDDPIEDLDDWRDSSLKISGSSNSPGLSPTDIFCSLTKSGSSLLLYVGTKTWVLGGLLSSVLGAFAAFLFFKRRDLFGAVRLYLRHLPTFVLIGIITLPIGIAFNLLTYALGKLPPFNWLLDWMDNSSGSKVLMAAFTGGIQQTVMVLLIAPPVIRAVIDSRNGLAPSVIRSLRLSYEHIRTIASALVQSTIAISAMLFVLLGVPFAVLFAVRWQFLGQAILVGDAKNGRDSLHDSGAVVRGRWWRVLSDSLLFQLIAIIPGPLVGVILMVIGGRSVNFVNTFSSVVYAVTVPISVIGLTLEYLRYREEAPSVVNVLQPTE